jgi:hypothetical protein
LPCIVLSARGLLALAGIARARGPVAPLRVHAGIVLLAFVALATFLPWRAVDKYFRYRGVRADVRSVMASHDFGRSLVLVRGVRHRDYGAAAVYNPTDLAADAPVFAWDRGPDVRAALLRAYPDRPVWVLEGATRSARGFRVSAGPLPPGAPIPETVPDPEPTPR